MIDYKNMTPEELAKYYTGLGYLIADNAGGIMIGLSSEIQGVFYKIDKNHFVLVSEAYNFGKRLQNAKFQIPREDHTIDFGAAGLIFENDVRPVKNIRELRHLVGLRDRITFEPSKYSHK